MLGAEVFLYFDEQHRTHAVRLEPSNQTKVGETVDLYFDPNRIHIFDTETEENILNLYRKVLPISKDSLLKPFYDKQNGTGKNLCRSSELYRSA